jgi:hypothetical protein
MPRMTMSVPHGLSQEEALRRIKTKSQDVLSQFGGQVKDLEEAWADHVYSFRFATMGMKIRGKVQVESSEIQLEAEVPLFALAFRGMVEGRVRSELGEILAANA